ncbi:hypothetical protein [Microcella frigidaquae]|uniref:DUF4337 domain-containing protein n=1 Tax=Microcella frigidaquae TaxID=424758 RepID=A0A840XGD8_9MICO|nr:hypothetical protein [Microcella frigidaquae]MBB5617562.1 hypothetical protein [Microcella frigidaquae]NHN45813.1 DUF4337 domain-containing protein [Microcella frigidaquae]
MTTPETASSAPATPLTRLFSNTELVIVILLGIVSVATAWVSFQAALYDGQTAKALSQSQSATAEAESLYLEGNQEYVQDAQTLARLTELQAQIDFGDAATSALAAETYDALFFVAVSEHFGAAIERAAAANAADPEFYTSPLDDEEYQNVLFGAYGEKSEEAVALTAQADELDARGDWLTLTTVLMAISLFLLGVAAVVRSRRVQYALIGIGAAIFIFAGGLMLTVPVTWV